MEESKTTKGKKVGKLNRRSSDGKQTGIGSIRDGGSELPVVGKSGESHLPLMALHRLEKVLDKYSPNKKKKEGEMMMTTTTVPSKEKETSKRISAKAWSKVGGRSRQ